MAGRSSSPLQHRATSHVVAQAVRRGASAATMRRRRACRSGSRWMTRSSRRPAGRCHDRRGGHPPHRSPPCRRVCAGSRRRRHGGTAVSDQMHVALAGSPRRRHGRSRRDRVSDRPEARGIGRRCRRYGYGRERKHFALRRFVGGRCRRRVPRGGSGRHGDGCRPRRGHLHDLAGRRPGARGLDADPRCEPHQGRSSSGVRPPARFPTVGTSSSLRPSPG